MSNFYNDVNVNGNKVTGLATPTANTDAANKAYVDSKGGTVTSVNGQTPTAGAVTVTATNIAISDTNNNFPTNTVQGAIDSLFTFANNGKTTVANAIGSPATTSDTFAQLAAHITNLKNKTYGVEKTVLLDEPVQADDIIRAYYKTMSVSKSADPSGTFGAFASGGFSSTATVAFATAFSDNGYLAVGCNGSAAQGFVHVFSQNTDGRFTKCPIPTTQPTAQCNGIAISKEGTYVAAGTTGTTNLWIYKRSGDSFTSTKPSFSNASVTISPAMTSGVGRDCDFTADSNFLAVGHSGAPYVSFYQRTGDTFIKQSTPATGDITADVYGVSWSADGTYLACVTNAGDVHVFKRSVTTLTKVWSTTVAGACWSVSFSPDGTYLAVGHSTFPFLTLFKKDAGDTWTTGVSITAPAGTVRGITWSPESMYLCTAHSSGTFMSIYRRSATADSFSRQSDPVTQVPAQGNGITFSADQTYWAVAHSSSPLSAGNPVVSIYQNNSTTELFRKMSSPSASTVSTFDVAFGIAKEAGVAGESKKCSMIVGGGVT